MFNTKTRLRALLISSTVVVLMAGTLRAEVDDAASTLVEHARKGYAGAGPFHETLDIEVTMPDGKTMSTRQDYGVGPNGNAFLRLTANGRAGLRIVGSRDRVVAIWEQVEGRHVESSYGGNLADALSRIEAGQLGLAAPPPVVAAQGGSADAFTDALRFGILGPVESISLAAGRRDTIELRAANGSCIVAFSSGSGLFGTLHCTLGQAPNQLSARGTFTFTTGTATEELALPDTANSLAIPTLTKLEASEYPLGGEVPSVTLVALDGRNVDLAAARGKFIVLDFWATWCVPCWSALEQTEALTIWARSSGKPVVVYAVNTLERASGLDARRNKAMEFLSKKGLELDVLLDADDKAFASFHEPGLPSLVIIDREGRLVDYHSGVLPDMVETIKTKIDELMSR